MIEQAIIMAKAIKETWMDIINDNYRESVQYSCQYCDSDLTDEIFNCQDVRYHDDAIKSIKHLDDCVYRVAMEVLKKELKG